jgi:uncharacterized short protein YbdD (DUF466 family)
MRPSGSLTRLGVFLRHVAAIARRVSGVPDYDRYVAHVRAHHPGTEPLGWDQFYRARLEDRYSKPGARCC